MRNQSFKRGNIVNILEINALIIEKEEDLVASLQRYTVDNLINHRV